MSTYAIGDVQGCYAALLQLLTKIQFNPQKDRLWFTGDLINRGSQSLEVLRLIKNLGNSAITVLGNHDLHYLAVASKAVPLGPKDTFQAVLAAEDAAELFDWLKNRPLMHYDKDKNFLLVHAGIAPEWGLDTAFACAHEVENILKNNINYQFFSEIYGNLPSQWDADLTGADRLRVIINYFTRMRYIDQNNHLDLNYSCPVGEQPEGLTPWFKMPLRIMREIKGGINILFGHWAALKGKTDMPNIFALDTGCYWGNALTALRLEDLNYFSINCSEWGKNIHD